MSTPKRHGPRIAVKDATEMWRISMIPPPYVAQSEHGDDLVVVSPVGDFDIDGTDKLRRAFTEAVSSTRCKVVVDLSECTFMDSMALGTVIAAAKRAEGWGGWLRLVAPTAYVRKVLRVTNLDTVFGVYETVDDAILDEFGRLP